MRQDLTALLLSLSIAPALQASPAAPPAVTAPTTAAASIVAAVPQQADAITSIDVYGLRKTDEALVRETLGFVAGEPMTADAATLEARLAALPGVAAAQVALIRYPGNAALFVGIREEGSPQPRFRQAPTGSQRLDAELLALHERSGELLMPAIRAGQALEDNDAGHSLSRYEPLRELQLGFVAVADARFDELVDVLEHAADPASRAAAASLVAYASDKAAVATALQRAADDPDEVVRNNAVRALGIVAGYALEHPELGIVVDPAPFLTLIESPTWTDRNKGAAALSSLSRSRDPQLLAVLAERSLDELAEMAVWRSAGHAGFALSTLARVAGVPEVELEQRSRELYADAEGRAAWVAELLANIAASRATTAGDQG